MGAPGSKDVDGEGVLVAPAVGTATGCPVSSFGEQGFPLASLAEAYDTSPEEAFPSSCHVAASSLEEASSFLAVEYPDEASSFLVEGLPAEASSFLVAVHLGGEGD